MKGIILAIESSCDDTSASVVIDGVIKSNCLATQSIHETYGGVVPEVASRAHQENIVPVVQKAVNEAGIVLEDLQAIAFTRGPGLRGSLIVGISFAKGLALSLGIPLLDVNHLEAHVLAHLAEDPKPIFPYLCLTVSGGHTSLVWVESPFSLVTLGKTIDDAAGEAFDKTGKLLGLPYPAGPHIDKLAQQGTPQFAFPEPRIAGLDFSFSGLKTSILYFLQAQVKENPGFIAENLPDLCASVQDRIVRILMNKLEKAVKLHAPAWKEAGIRPQVAIAGGVAANSGLRQALLRTGETKNWQTYIPDFSLCTDNAGMIGIAGYYKYLQQDFCSHNVEPMERWGIPSSSS